MGSGGRRGGGGGSGGGCSGGGGGGLFVQVGGGCLGGGGFRWGGGRNGDRVLKWIRPGRTLALQSFRITHLINAEIFAKFCRTRETKLKWKQK